MVGNDILTSVIRTQPDKRLKYMGETYIELLDEERSLFSRDAQS